MAKLKSGRCSGFTLNELLVSLALGTLVLGGAVSLFRKAIDASFMVTNRGEMQQNARVGLNSLSRDVSLAGSGLPVGGVQLPSGSGSTASRFGCDSTTCYVTNNLYPSNHLYGVIPGSNSGPTINGVATDSVTVVLYL